MFQSHTRVVFSVLLLALSLNSVSVSASTCADGHYCLSAVSVTDAVKCSPGQYCNGFETGRLCNKGYYCPDPTQEIICPSGYYCPPASIEPRPCSPLATCKEGSYRYFHWGTLLLLLILLPLIAAAPYFYKKANEYYRNSLSAKNAELSAAKQASGDVSAALKPVPAMDIKFSNLQAAIQVKGVEKVILQDVTGHFKAGRLVACMGPSVSRNILSALR